MNVSKRMIELFSNNEVEYNEENNKTFVMNVNKDLTKKEEFEEIQLCCQLVNVLLICEKLKKDKVNNNAILNIKWEDLPK